MNSSRTNILLIEDNDDDVFLLRRALNGKADVTMHIATDGQEAVDYLSGKGQYSDRSRYPWPDLTLLDLKLPLIDGLHALAWLREQPATATLPVIVLTSSYEERDRKRAAELGVLSYHVKPPSPTFVAEFSELIAALPKGRA